MAIFEKFQEKLLDMCVVKLDRENDNTDHLENQYDQVRLL
jgi:hypothetical protein